MDAAQRQELILSLVPFSALVVGDFLRQSPQFYPIASDLRAAARVTLVELSERGANMTRSHFQNYLRRSIWNGCWDAVRLENVIQTPRVHKAQRRPFFEYGGGDCCCEVGVPEDEDVEAPDEILHDGEFHELTSAEALYESCNDASDRRIVKLAEKGHTRTQIARKLKMKRNEVKRRAEQILARFEELY